MRTELDAARRELDAAAARLVEDGLAAWSGGPERERSLIVRGRANLLQNHETAADLEKVRVLFDDLEQKEQLIGLLDGVNAAQGRAHLHRRGNTVVFTFGFRRDRGALYDGRQRVLGAIGVIGPARLNYARIIPLVDYTARVLGRMLDGQDT
jgi:heat-inducible transcriptional repressor